MYEELEGLHRKELLILEEFDRVCKNNQLTYYLAFGTLLGAVRHKGFIPWDDDIDVCMPYNDYVKLREACKKSLNDDFFLQTEESDPDSRLSYYKLRLSNTTLIIDYLADRNINHGINIDIYPLYNIPDKGFLRKIQLFFSALYFLFQVEQVPENHGSIMKIICFILLHIFRGKSRKKIKKFCHNQMSKYEGTNTKKKAMLFGNISYCRKTYPSKIFESTVPLEFEGKMFYAPKGYRDYLRLFYGDYMKLPPQKEQGVKLDHIIKIDTDVPYKHYFGKLYCNATSSKIIK